MSQLGSSAPFHCGIRFFELGFELGKDILVPTRHPHSTDEVVPATGIYVVHHAEHRLPHDVILIAGDKFPRCSKCGVSVKFALFREARAGSELSPVRVYELPDLDDEDEQADPAKATG